MTIVGARQSGKTTLSKKLAASLDGAYRTLDNPIMLTAARQDPTGFISHDQSWMLIAEVQKAPILLPVIKEDVDNNPLPGRFLLTGSAALQALPSVTESLAGRIKKIRLRPLAIGEIYAREPRFLSLAFSGSWGEVASQSLGKESYIKLAMQGGYPEAILLETERGDWHRDYVQAILDRDLQDIMNIKRQQPMTYLLEMMAAWSSKFIDMSSLCQKLALTRPTVNQYLAALEGLFLIESVRPWYKTDYDRVGKRAKWFMSDSGLMASLLRWHIDQVRWDGDLCGKLIETFVYNQLMAIIDANQGAYRLYHYRDREKREIDFIIESDDGALLGIEVKAGSMVDGAMFKHMRWFKENLVKSQDFTALVLYTGEHAVSFGEKMWAIPMHYLWG